MPRQAATIGSLPQAFEVVKEMQAGGPDRGEGYRPLGRQAPAEIIEGRMAEAVDRRLDGLDGSAMRDRRNGTCRRGLPSELGDIALDVPRTRHFCPTEVLKSHARRAPEIDRAILAGFVPGLSTRKVGEVLLALPGRPVSAATVSRVARTLDLAVAAFHRRPLKNACKALMPDGALGRPVLVALGIRHDGRKEIIDFQRAASESAAERERFLTALHRRGLTGEGLEMICVDGGQGLLAALPIVWHGIPVQRCRAHRIRNILDKVRVADRQAVKADVHAVMNAPNRRKAETAARRFADAWEDTCPQGRRLPAQRPRRPAHLLPLQGPRRAKADQDHQRHRTEVPRGSQTNPAHGNLPGQNLHGPHHPRGLHSRKQVAGNQDPTLPDT